MIVAPYTFHCRELLFVLGRMLPPPDLAESGTVTQAAAQLANTLARDVAVVDDHDLAVELDEPVEAVALARELELRVERCIASPLALDLLRESGAPARASWAWLRQRLGVETDPADGLVVLRGVARDRLPATFDRIPDGDGVLVWILGREDRIAFVDRATTIGRGRGADVVLDEETLSRVHAAIVPYRGTWAIEDRESASGTYIDDHQIGSRCLVPGMTIRLGRVQLVVLSVRS